MTDFLRALETELTAAARRKAARRARPWWRRAPRLVLPRPSLVAVAGVALLAIALGIAVAALRGGGDRTASPGPAPGTPLRALAPIVSCPTAPQAVPTPVPGLSDFDKTLAVFRRAQREPDGLSVPSGVTAAASPPGCRSRSGRPTRCAARRWGCSHTPVQLVPGNGTPGDPGCAQRGTGTQPVVCMVTDGARPSARAASASHEIRAGRALRDRRQRSGGRRPRARRRPAGDAAVGRPHRRRAGQREHVRGRAAGRRGGHAGARDVRSPGLPERRDAAGAPAGRAGADAADHCRGGAAAGDHRHRHSRARHLRRRRAPGHQLEVGALLGRAGQPAAVQRRARAGRGRSRRARWPPRRPSCSASPARPSATSPAARSRTRTAAAATSSPSACRRRARTPRSCPRPRAPRSCPPTEGVIGGFLPAGVKPTEVGKVTYRPTGRQAADAQIVTVVNASGVSGARRGGGRPRWPAREGHGGRGRGAARGGDPGPARHLVGPVRPVRDSTRPAASPGCSGSATCARSSAACRPRRPPSWSWWGATCGCPEPRTSAAGPRHDVHRNGLAG